MIQNQNQKRSQGRGRYFGAATCGAANIAYKALIDNLKSLGIATIAASGNGGWVDSMNAPGCISTAISVGAANDSNGVASVSSAPHGSTFCLRASASIRPARSIAGGLGWNGAPMAFWQALVMLLSA